MSQGNSLQERAKRSLSISWKEGIPAAVMLGVLDYYLIPYGLFLGATTQEIGLLVALPHLVASIAQLFAVRVVRWAGSRLRFLVAGTFLQAGLLIPAAFLAFSLPAGRAGRIGALVFLMVLFRVLGNLIGTAWGSLVSDYLPAEKRGHYFGWRAQIVGVAGLLGIAFAGLLLFWMRGISAALGFFLLFSGAALFRFASFYLMSRMVDLPLHEKPEDEFTFLMFLRRFRESNFVKYVLYVSSITFATHLSAPYLSVYMLRDLHFNYLNYMLVHLSAVLTGLVAFPIWGKHADLVGNAKILKITSRLFPLIPLGWLLSKNLFYLMALEMFAGFVWGGFNLCAANFIYDAVTPEKRVRCLGYFNLINGIALFLGTSLGGFLAERLPPLLGYSFYALFLLSSLIRFLAHFFLSRRFQEVRASARKVSSIELFFSVAGIRPLAGLNREWNVFPSVRPSSPEP